jgi:dTDP-4-amino-4,6-dideoxygalactose transaminase
MNEIKNFLPNQYAETGKLEINHNYLQQQFEDYHVIFEKISKTVQKGDFTLGAEVDLLENEFAGLVGCKYAIGVGSGTDAIFLSIKALGIGEGDEVITTPYTFYATIGAIVTAGATPVFVDIDSDYNINPEKIEQAITSKTKAILLVHWTGKPCEMDSISLIAKRYNLPIIEDACHAICASYKGIFAGNLGTIGCFSFHPLKNLNVWGDGGIVTTNSEILANQLKLLRNHGLVDRDHCAVFAYNSRLDTIQAIVARHLLDKIDFITESRIRNASFFDEELSKISEISIPVREPHIRQVFHLYIIRCQKRDQLQSYLIENGIDAKIHYPVPMHLQPAAAYLGYQRGDFPVCEVTVDSIISLPVHEFITEEQLSRVVNLIKLFYGH